MDEGMIGGGVFFGCFGHTPQNCIVKYDFKNPLNTIVQFVHRLAYIMFTFQSALR